MCEYVTQLKSTYQRSHFSVCERGREREGKQQQICKEINYEPIRFVVPVPAPVVYKPNEEEKKTHNNSNKSETFKSTSFSLNSTQTLSSLQLFCQFLSPSR